MNFVSHYECTLCHQEYPKDFAGMTCPKCGEKGILDIIYDYEKMKTVITKDYFIHNKNYSILRYAPLMSIQEKNISTLKVGWTPLYHSSNLGTKLGLDKLFFKDETVNPTASLKDRASIVACLKAIEQGKNTICCSSTGNAASSLAGNAAKLGLKTVIVVPERAPIGKLTQLVMYGSNVIRVKGDYKQAFELSKKLINSFHLYNRNAAINPHLVEGKKTVAYEIAEQLQFDVPDMVFVSVGDGCTIGGVYKGFYDLKKLSLISKIPKIIGVQAEGCSPFYDAYINKRPLQETEENTFADSIAVGIPRNPVKGMNAVTLSKGQYIKVRDDEILEAMKILGKTEGIFAEPAGATSLAGLLKLYKNNQLNKEDKIAIIVTGNGLKDPNSVFSYVEKNTIQFNPSIDNSIPIDSMSLEELLTILKERSEQNV
jgi:threonine synthase